MIFSRIGIERPTCRRAILGVLSCFLWSAHGAAQSESAALAEALFQEGRALLERGEYPTACAKLGESYRLDPATGTLLNLAYCHEREGKVATAWAEFQTALGRVRREGREERAVFARDSIARVEKRLPRLLVQVNEGADPALRVWLADIELGRAAWGAAMPVDPAPIVVRATAPGCLPFEAVVTPKEGETLTLTIPVLSSERSTSEDHTPQAAPAPASPSPDAPAQEPPPTDFRRTSLYVAGGVGVLGAAAGSYFGVLAIAQKNDSDPGCDDDGCSPEAGRTYEDAQRNATLSNVGFGVGALGLGVAAYLFFTEPEASSGGAKSRTAPSAAHGTEPERGKLTAWAVVPLVAQDGAGVTVSSRF